MPFLVWLDTQEAVLVNLKRCLQEQTRLVRVPDRFHTCWRMTSCGRRAMAGPAGPKLSMDFYESYNIPNRTGL